MRHDSFGEYIWLYLVGPELEPGTKCREAAIGDHVLTVLDRWLQGWWLGFGPVCLVRVQFHLWSGYCLFGVQSLYF